jgi:hypothetical protein
MNYEKMLEYLKNKKTQNHIDKLAKKYNDKTILIYGAGLFFDVLFENFDLSKLNIIAISDKKFEHYEEFKGIRAISPSNIKDLSFDIILIATFAPESIEKYIKQEFYSECDKFKIDYLNEYTFKEFFTDIKNAFHPKAKIYYYDLNSQSIRQVDA